MAKASSIISAPSAVIRFLREAREELRKVSWPSRETTVQYTIIVIVSSLVVGFVIGGVDYALTFAIEKYLIN